MNFLTHTPFITLPTRHHLRVSSAEWRPIRTSPHLSRVASCSVRLISSHPMFGNTPIKNSDRAHAAEDLNPAPCFPRRSLHRNATAQPSLFGASLTSKIVLCSSCLVLSSLIILLSILASSPSNFSIGFGVTASSTKWLSQCGQYSSLSSNSWASFRKTFLHFLQAKVWRMGLLE